MSALGSSVINKSGKKFAPKAPARRPAAPAAPVPDKASARQSHDRQSQSQTPQPQILPQQATVSPAPSVSIPTSTPSHQHTSIVPAGAIGEDDTALHSSPPRQTPGQDSNADLEKATSIPVLPRISPARTRTSPPPILSQKRSLEPQQKIDNAEVDKLTGPGEVSQTGISSPASNEPNFMDSNFALTSNHSSTQVGGKELNLADAARTTSDQHAAPKDGLEPAAKRRRIEETQPQIRAVHFSAPESSTDAPLPTTETNDITSEVRVSTEPSRLPSSAVTVQEPQSSVQGKRRQRIEDAAAEIVADAVGSKSSKQKKPRKNAKGKGVQRLEGKTSGSVTAPPAEPGGESGQTTVPAKPKRKYTRKSKQSIQDTAAAIVEDAVQGSSKHPKKRGRRSKRAVTPDGADGVRIAPSEIKMSELCTDSHTGRKSEREKDLAEAERAEFVRKKQRQLQEVMGQADPDTQGDTSESAEARLERLGRRREREESVANNVPNTIIVDGQIQIDEDSLEIDRHKEAADARAEEQLEDVDETDLTRKVNSFSFLKRDMSGGWNELLTDRFYEGLRMFGTDFGMISKMFPGRTRHKIKLKFVKEEKFSPDKIKATLLNEQVPVDLPEFEKMAGVEFDDPEILEREMAEDRKRLEEETLAEKQAMDEIRNARDAEIAAERAAVGEESSAKENRRGKGRKKGEKQKSKKGSTKRKERRAPRPGASGAAEVLGEIGGSEI